MYQQQFTFPFIKEALQRFDIADHTLLTDSIYGVAADLFSNSVLSSGVGRVMYGFKVASVSSTQAKISGAGLAATGYGDLLVRASGDADVTISGPTAGGGWAASKQYPVYAYMQEQEVTPTVNRKKWDTGTDSEATVSVSVLKKKVPLIYVGAAVTIGTIVMSTYFPATVVDTDGVTRRVLPLAVIETNGSSQIASITDTRQMFAIDGNVSGTVTGLGSELPHNFAPTDTKTLGINSIRDHLKAIADRIKTITGESTWYADPDANIAAIVADLAAVRREGITVAANYTALKAIAPGDRNDNDIRLIRDGGIFVFVAASAATAVENQVIVPNTGTGRWIRYDDGYMKNILGAQYGAEFSSSTVTRTRVKEMLASQIHWQNASVVKILQGVTPAEDWFSGTTSYGAAVFDLPPGAIVTRVEVMGANNHPSTDLTILLYAKKIQIEDGSSGPTTASMFATASKTLTFAYDGGSGNIYSQGADCDASEATRTLSDLYAESIGGDEPSHLHIGLTVNSDDIAIYSVKVFYRTARVRG